MEETERDIRMAEYKVKKRVGSPADFPTEAHLGIIEFGSIYIPGDERSRTLPGHGYPATTETTVSYYVYPLEAEELWRYRITKLETDRTSYIAIKNGVRVKVTMKAVVEVG